MRTTPDQRPVVHSTFSLERSYPSPPARVFDAFTNPARKRRWFAEGEGWEIEEFSMDFRVGGRDSSRFRFQGGQQMGYDAVYLDIVAERRIVFAYTMTAGTAGDKRDSVSLATVELTPSAAGTRLVYTEQGAFFAGDAYAEGREIGSRELLEQLAQELETYG